MAEYGKDEQREHQRKQNEEASAGSAIGSLVKEYLGARATSIATSALLDRAGYSTVLHKNINKLTYFAKRMAGHSSNKAFEDWTISNVRKLKHHAPLEWSVTKKETANLGYTPDLTDNRTLLYAMFRGLKGYSNDFRAEAERRWNQEFVAPQAMNEVIGKYEGNIGTKMVRRGQAFIKSILSEVDRSDINVYKLKHEHFNKNDSAEMAFANELIDAVQKYKNPAKDAEFRGVNLQDFKERTIKDFQKEAHAAAKEIFDPTKMAKQFALDEDSIEKIAGVDQRVRMKDFLANLDKINIENARVTRMVKQGDDYREEQIDLIKQLKSFDEHLKNKAAKSEAGKKAYETFLNLVPDLNLYKSSKTGEFYSKRGLTEIQDTLLGIGANTLPGKIMKLRDMQYSRMAPQVLSLMEGSLDPVLAAATNDKNGPKSNFLQNHLYYIYGDIYKSSPDNKLEYLEDISQNYKMVSGKYGARKHLIKQLSGEIRYQKSDNFFLKALDIGQDRDQYTPFNFTEKVSSLTRKVDKNDDTYLPNVVRHYFNADETEAFIKRKESSITLANANNFFFLTNKEENERILQKEKTLDILKDASQIKEFLDDNTSSISRDSARVLAEELEEDQGKELAKILGDDSTDDLIAYFLERINSADAKTTNEAIEKVIDNTKLRKTFRGILDDQYLARQKIYETPDKTGFHEIASSVKDIFDTSTGKTVIDFDEQFRREASKELVMNMLTKKEDAVISKYSGFEEVEEFFKKAGLSKTEHTNISRMLSSVYFESETGINNAMMINNVDSNRHALEQLHSYAKIIPAVMQHDEDYGKIFRENVQNLLKEVPSYVDKSYDELDDVINPAHLNDWVGLRKDVDVMDVLTSLNDFIKAKANTKQYFRQWIAGRNDMENVSDNTLIPYFFMSRLSDEMNNVGLGFSKDSLGSSIDLAKGIFLKRALPIGLGLTYAEWFDDASEAATGRSISGAMAGGVAEFDIASRKVLDTFGITDWLKAEKQINPIMQYWGEHDEFMSADERRGWYENGYDPVRKGAWWTFGGVNEARGSEIQYFTPTWVRRIQSDYKDKALYNGFFDKWSHSLLPTPSNPLSPIMGLLDPYWLEERHKEDRPYLLTGHMFNDGTPWGAVLNSTIGDIIKPQKDLHTFLGFEYRNINGIDPKSMLHAMNQQIKQWARDVGHRNYIQLNGDSFTPVNITEYDAPTQDSKTMSIQFKDGQIVRSSQSTYGVYTPGNALTQSTESALAGMSGVKLLDAIESVGENRNNSLKKLIDYKLFGGMPPVSGNEISSNTNGQAILYDTKENKIEDKERKLKTEEELEVSLATEGDILGIKNAAITAIKHYNPIETIRQINEGTKDSAEQKVKNASPSEFDDEEGIISGDKLKHYRPADAMELINDPDTVTQLINTGKGNDMIQEAAVSWRLISGIYGYMLGAQTGFGVDNQKRIATSADMTSFSRSFWDEGYGGLGGPAMEIIRRFIPDYRRNSRINPLMNTMPDWLPDRFRYGDPYTSVLRGEMRLPGKGFESLNELHPDAYGKYGAFDRMKILADIAPFSPEYRLWRDIAKKTVTDPELVDQMDDIKQRVNQQGKKHDFYEYKVVGHGIDYKEVVVSELLDYGKFRSGNSIFKIAGASLKGNQEESMKDVLGRYIRPGDKVTVAVDDDSYAHTNNDSVGSIEAAVFRDGENIGENMIANGDAAIRKGSTSAAALAGYSTFQRGLAYSSEFIAHLDIPWLSDQFLRVRSPLESYEAEQVYGTPYQSWETPFESFVEPAFIRAIHDRSAFTGLLGTFDRYVNSKPGATKGQKHLAHLAWIFGDRGAFMGAALSIPIGLKTHQSVSLARHTSALATAGHFFTGGNGMADEIMAGANLGQEVARFFEKNRVIGAAAGAIVGAGYRLAFGDENDWIPERVKKKWEMEDYFDRLTYIKYRGLFKLAAKKAKDEEDVDLEQLLKTKEKHARQNQFAISYFKNLKKKLVRSIPESDGRDELSSMLTKRINALDSAPEIMQGGKWTRTALLYKQVADSTMYGLKDNATWSQIITALPTNDREYFMEFVKERNPDKRKKILNTVSPFLKRALQMAWGKKDDIKKPEDNKKYFKKHQLPKENWAGWAPQVDLKDVEVKTIENEAMSLADFGFYSSQAEDPEVLSAPNLERNKGTKDLERKLKAVLTGQGLKDVDISISPGPAGGGTSMIAAIKTMLGFRQQQKQIDESLSMQSV